jgi:hypothetical protein
LGTISRKFKTLKLKFVLGFGTLLMEEAERIAREEHGAHKLAVISGEKFFPIKMNFWFHNFYFLQRFLKKIFPVTKFSNRSRNKLQLYFLS